MMFGQMTAGSWIYIGSQGIVQGTYETFAEAGRQHCGGDLADKWILTAGLGGMGGAQPLAATMAGASMLAIECQPSRIDMRLKTRYLDRRRPHSTKRSRCCATRRRRASRCRSASSATPPKSCPSWSAGRAPRHGDGPDVGARPRLRLSARRLERGTLARRAGRSCQHAELTTAAKQSIKAHVAAMLAFHAQGIPTFDTATTSVRSRSMKVSPTPSRFRGSCRRTSGRCSAKARDPSAGPRCRVTPRTSRRPTAR